MGELHALCRTDELPSGRARRFDVAGTKVCLVRLGDAWHAIGDTCTHQDISLTEGDIDADERTIECWKHGSLFSLETGEALTLPATQPVPTYAVEVDGVQVHVRMP